MPLFSPSSKPDTSSTSPKPRRVLFLDDDPERAEIFLKENPDAVWVQTAEECITRLSEPWDEVHLDHDLGGEQFVDHQREDCGMEVVRWISLELRPHLRTTRFLIHSHNPVGSMMMSMQMMVNGYIVEQRPFGRSAPEPAARDRLFVRLKNWLRSLIRRESDEDVDDYGYLLDPAANDEPLPLRPDFHWTEPPAKGEKSIEEPSS